MAYDDFVKLALKQDIRNNFQPCDSDLSFLPVQLRSFYVTYNPVDVEVVLRDLTSVRFSPAKNLKKLQNEYIIDGSSFVFSTQEGDPVYYKFDGIFISPHGSATFKETKISNDFDSYIEMLLEKML